MERIEVKFDPFNTFVYIMTYLFFTCFTYMRAPLNEQPSDMIAKVKNIYTD